MSVHVPPSGYAVHQNPLSLQSAVTRQSLDSSSSGTMIGAYNLHDNPLASSQSGFANGVSGLASQGQAAQDAQNGIGGGRDATVPVVTGGGGDVLISPFMSPQSSTSFGHRRRGVLSDDDTGSPIWGTPNTVSGLHTCPCAG